MKLFCLQLALVCSWLLMASQPVSAQVNSEGYQLTLERPEDFGNYYAFKSEVNKSIHTIESLDGKQIAEDKKTVEATIVGTAWVSDANLQGEIAEVVIYPNEFSGKVNGKDVDITLGERLFVQMKDGKVNVFSSAGHTMPAEVIQVMDALLGFMLVTDEKNLSLDAMFALDQPRKPGQSWKADNELLATSLAQVWEIRAEPKQIESSMTFAKVDKLFDEDAAKLDVAIKLKQFNVPGWDKRGLKIDKSAGSINIQRVLPLKQDGRNGKVSKQIDLSITASADQPGQGNVQMQRTTKLKTQAEYQIQ